MKEQNSYAYIGNSKEKVIKEGNTFVILPRVSPRECIKGIFEQEKIQIVDSSRTRLVFTAEVIPDNDFFKVKVTIDNVKHNFYVDIEVEGESKDEAIKCLEYIHKKLEESELNTKDDYIQVITYDAISEYYCNEIFKDLAQFERKLRNLLLNTYVVYFGEKYYLHQFDGDIENKIKGKVRGKGSETKIERKRMQEAFYEVDLQTILDMLFTPKVSNYEIDRISKTLSRTKDLSSLSDSELRNLLSSAITPKSDWERFFADKIEETDFKALLKRIKDERNKVAHQKFFYKKDFLKLKEDLSIVIAAIDQAIEITKDKEFSKQNTEYLRERVFEIAESLSKIADGFIKSIGSSMEVLGKNLLDVATNYYSPKLNLREGIDEDEPETDNDNIE